MRDYYDINYDSDSDYDLITESVYNVQSVTNVSMLRHYKNCWGITKMLVEHLSPLTKNQLNSAAEVCFGNTTMSELIEDYDEIIQDAYNESIERELRANRRYELIEQLKEKRNNYCGLDTRNVKLLLNKLSKTDPVAMVYRYLLEAEDYNIKAKDTYGEYSDKCYNKKSEFIDKSVEVCRQNNFSFGITKSDVPGVSHIIYFDIPGCEQISFHTTLNNPQDYPSYNKEWDGIVNSTLAKIESAIMERYSTEIEAKKQQLNKKKKKNTVVD